MMGKTFGHDADHDVRFVVEQDLFAGDVWIAAEALLPEGIAENGRWCSAGLVIRVVEVAPQHRRHAHRSEVATTNDARVEVLRLVCAGDVEDRKSTRLNSSH